MEHLDHSWSETLRSGHTVGLETNWKIGVKEGIEVSSVQSSPERLRGNNGVGGLTDASKFTDIFRNNVVTESVPEI